MSEDRKVGLTFGLLMVAMMIAVEVIGWQRVAAFWLVLFVGSLVIKLVRLVLPCTIHH